MKTSRHFSIRSPCALPASNLYEKNAVPLQCVHVCENYSRVHGIFVSSHFCTCVTWVDYVRFTFGRHIHNYYSNGICARIVRKMYSRAVPGRRLGQPSLLLSIEMYLFCGLWGFCVSRVWQGMAEAKQEPKATSVKPTFGTGRRRRRRRVPRELSIFRSPVTPA